jgi:predicted nuclease of predicted toxin-antitoxin system
VRILAHENFPGEAVTTLRQHGHDVAWVRTDAPGSSDQEVLQRAQAEGRVVVTFDKDFGELAFRYGLPASSGIILFRIAALSSGYVNRITVTALESRSDWAGHFAVIEENRIRMRPLPGLEEGEP